MLAGLECELQPIPTEAYPTLAKRPRNSRLDASRLSEAYGIQLPSWKSALRDCLNS